MRCSSAGRYVTVGAASEGSSARPTSRCEGWTAWVWAAAACGIPAGVVILLGRSSQGSQGGVTTEPGPESFVAGVPSFPDSQLPQPVLGCCRQQAPQRSAVNAPRQHRAESARRAMAAQAAGSSGQ